MKRSKRHLLLSVLAMACGLVGITLEAQAETMSLQQLRQATHIHGIGVDPGDPAKVLLATHHGFFTVTPDGQATRRSTDRNDYMGFTPHPTDPDLLYASGHPVGGGNMGVIVSRDGGNQWSQLAKGVNGPVDFHQMDISKADPTTLYGVHGGLQVSHDGGKSWAVKGPLPEGLYDLTASSQQVERLYAGTKTGLRVSDDAGGSWRNPSLYRAATPMVQSAGEGEVYAFMVGVGLLKNKESNSSWQVISRDWGQRYLLHLAADPSDPKRLYGVTGQGDILTSQDGGHNWKAFGSQP